MFDSFKNFHELRWQINATDLNSVHGVLFLLIMYSQLLSFILSSVIALLAMAFYTLMERKFLGYFQLRKGPNKVGLTGLPQPFADAIKLFSKERTTPTLANLKLFYISPALGLLLTLILWRIYPHSNTSIYISFGTLFFLCVSRINVYVIFFSGWCSNSKYSLLGALRGVAQTISYEVSMALILINALIFLYIIDFHSMPTHLYTWTATLIMPLFIIWFITNLAETNRTPFDLAEGESELVSGFNTEYRRGIFALLFIAEYANILVICLFTSLIFSGHTPVINNITLILKTACLATIFIWVRATLPRIRYDNLIYLTWKSFLPISLRLLLTTSIFMI